MDSRRILSQQVAKAFFLKTCWSTVCFLFWSWLWKFVCYSNLNCTPAFIVQDSLDLECSLQCFPTPGTTRSTYLSRGQAQSWTLAGRRTATSSWGPMKPRDWHFPLNSSCLSLFKEVMIERKTSCRKNGMFSSKTKKTHETKRSD